MREAPELHNSIDRAAHTVLVVDDNPATRYSTGRVIRAAGFGVQEAGTGAQALELSAGPDISAVVLDVHLPDMDGFQVCRAIRARSSTRLLPVVHLSAQYVKDEDQVAGLNAGADGYLVHPVEPSVLVATLQALIRARRAEDELRGSERRFRAIYDQAEGGIALVDAMGRFVEANPALLRMLGRTAEAIMGRTVAELAPADLRETTGHLLAGLGAAPWRGELTLLHADGHALHLQLSLSEPDRGLRVATVTDLTERHELEQRRRELLEREQAARAAAERHSRTKDDFIAVLSHELRTPLNAIVGWAHILRRRGITPEGLRGIEAIERNAQTQARIISDILDVSRINSGKLQLERQWVDPAELVRSSIGSLDASIAERHVQLETDLDGAHAPAWLDPARYQQICWNLMTNAVKFSQDGGRVEVSLARDGERLRLQVRDFGVGMDPEFMAHAFDRFTQSDAPGNRRHGGLGLGLSIVKHLAELHGGDVGAASAGPGTGTLVWVDLPAGQPAEEGGLHAQVPAPAAEPSAAVEPLRGVDVLVVEDDQEAREIMAMTLTDRGARVRVAIDYDAALAEIRAGWPQVIVSDIGLPGHDGYELARAVRALQPAGATRVPMVALTAFARPEDRRKALEAGFDLHMAKPLEPHRLVGGITDLLRSPA